MTRNQISYATLKETERSNRAVQGETARHNRADESIRSAQTGIQASQLGETIRHNLATEEINFQTLANQSAMIPYDQALKEAQAGQAEQQGQASVISAFGTLQRGRAAARDATTRAAQLQEQKRQYEDMAPYNKTSLQARSANDISSMARNIVSTVGQLLPWKSIGGK